MKLTNASSVPVYTISGSSTARPLPEWLARKRKRSLKNDPEFANRVELLQDFEFEEASSCIRISDDDEWVVSTGTYKPQIHCHYLPHLSLSFSRHTTSLNQTFELLSSDYTKQLHLQADRFVEFHAAGGLHYSTRIPRYGRDLKYDRRSAEALVPAVGVNQDGLGEVFRINLDVGRFMRSYEVDVGGDDMSTLGGGALQGGVGAGSVNTAAIASESHNLLSFGTSLGTVEFFDPRSKDRVGLLPPPPNPFADGRAEISCLEFHPSGLSLASGSSDGMIHVYDLRNPVPLVKRDQGYGNPIKSLTFLTSSSSRTSHLEAEPKIMSADKTIIKIWDARDGSPWTSVEPAVDLNCVVWNKDSGMILTANEGRQQHSFFIPQLGPAPKWARFLDNLVEEMAEDADDPAAFAGGTRKVGEVYDDFKFLTVPQLRAVNLDHLIGTTGLLRPYMHGYFVAQKLYEEARLISNPEIWQEQRQKSIREKIDKERESRIRGSKRAASVKVNKQLADRILEREEKNERRKARRAAVKATEAAASANSAAKPDESTKPNGNEAQPERATALTDARFAALFENEAFAIDESSEAFRLQNASTQRREQESASHDSAARQRLTNAEMEDLESRRGSSSDDSDDSTPDDDAPPARRDRSAANDSLSADAYRRNKRNRNTQAQAQRRAPQMRASYSSGAGRQQGSGGGAGSRAQSFGERAADLAARGPARTTAKRSGGGGVVGDREITFTAQSGGMNAKKAARPGGADREGDGGGEGTARQRRDAHRKERRSASNNVFRRM